MKTAYHKYIILFTICLISAFFHYKTINEFPQYKHCWAQSDRYALAVGFTENGYNFFYPQTLTLNNQFPDNYKTIKDNTITAVDFPIHDYTASLIMNLFKTKEPWCFRLYLLLYSIIGLFFIYKLSFLFTDSFTKSLTIVLFACSSPVFLYYQSGFLPSIPSLANSLIGLYFFFKYKKYNKIKDYWLSILFLTIAALARLPFAIILIAIISLDIFLFIKNRKKHSYKILAISISLIVILLYYMYNNHLRNIYGSLFLNYIIPANNFSELIDFIISIYKRWFYQYFTTTHYLLISILSLLFLSLFFRKKIVLSDIEKQILLFISILFLGCLLYFLLMSFQFIHHDYYFLDTFYTPFILLFLFLIIKFPDTKNKRMQIVVNVLFILIFIPSLVLAKKINDDERNQDFFKTETTSANNFKKADEFLKAINISQKAKILVIAPDGPNIPFLLMKRKGYVVMTPDYESIKLALNWPYDFVVIENAKLIHSVYNYYPEVLNELTKIASNDGISIFSKKTDNEKSNFDSFFNLNSKQAVYHRLVNFENSLEKTIHIDSLSSNHFSGEKSGYSNQDNQYGFSENIPHLNQLNQTHSILKVNSYFFSQKPLKDLMLCVSIKSEGKDVIFLANEFSQHIPLNLWTKKDFIFYLPQVKEKNYELSVFLWNRGKNEIFYDDFDLTIY